MTPVGLVRCALSCITLDKDGVHINGECKLCRRNLELQLSHIVPKFIGKWIKSTSASGYIRNAVQANRRIQDLPKQYLLCHECEELFSAYEKKFSQEIFYPFQNGQKQFHYDEWLQKFAVSLLWRVAISQLNSNLKTDHPGYKRLIETLEQWRKFLLHETKEIGRTKIHIVFVGINDIQDFTKAYDNMDITFSHHMNVRFLRSIDLGTVIDEESNRLFIFCSLTGILFVAHFYPESIKGWTNDTRIAKRGTLKNLQANSDLQFGQFLTRRVQMYDSFIAQLSEKQSNFLITEAQKDIQKVLDSRSLGLLNQIIKVSQK